MKSSTKLAWSFALLSLLLYFYLGYSELVARHDRPVQIDELCFATCAARASELGQWFSSGCHDNKGPVIYVIYGGLHRLAGVYNYAAYKVCALLFGLVLAGLAGRFAARLTGLATAGVVCFALVLQVFALDPWMVALKTESVGMVLVLLAITLIDASQKGLGRVALAGALLGLAFLTKQTFVFAAFALFLVLLANALSAARGERHRPWLQVICLGLGGVATLIAIGLVFHARGDLADAVSSVFVYPTVYASKAAEASMLKRVLLKFAAIAEAAQPFALLLVFGVAAAVHGRRAGMQAGRERLASLLFAAFVGVLLALLAAPVFLRFHLLPVLVMAAIFAGALLARLMVGLLDGPDRGWAPAVVAGVATVCVTVTLCAWGGQPANSKRDEAQWSRFKLAGHQRAYGYVIGNWPEFYVQSGLIPASGVMYPTALPGAPATWAYQPPDLSTRKGARLAELQARNAEQLKADFMATPPRVILVNPAMARAPGSSSTTDIAVLDAYLAAHCKESGEQAVNDREYRLGTLYVCDVGGPA
ncbi:MAG TPA: glycosyltransferase family 39 protein [Roseateles sp.]